MVDKIPQINCVFDSEELLYRAYMPFIDKGGLFIRTSQDYPLGSLINLSIEIMQEKECLDAEGKVVWITPKGAQGGKPSGIGVQFTGENCRILINKIETHLAGMLKSNRSTDTL